MNEEMFVKQQTESDLNRIGGELGASISILAENQQMCSHHTTTGGCYQLPSENSIASKLFLDYMSTWDAQLQHTQQLKSSINNKAITNGAIEWANVWVRTH